MRFGGCIAGRVSACVTGGDVVQSDVRPTPHSVMFRVQHNPHSHSAWKAACERCHTSPAYHTCHSASSLRLTCLEKAAATVVSVLHVAPAEAHTRPAHQPDGAAAAAVCVGSAVDAQAELSANDGCLPYVKAVITACAGWGAQGGGGSIRTLRGYGTPEFPCRRMRWGT